MLAIWLTTGVIDGPMETAVVPQAKGGSAFSWLAEEKRAPEIRDDDATERIVRKLRRDKPPVDKPARRITPATPGILEKEPILAGPSVATAYQRDIPQSIQRSVLAVDIPEPELRAALGVVEPERAYALEYLLLLAA